MPRIYLAFGLCGLLFGGLTDRLSGQQIEKDELAAYRQAGLNGGDPARGKVLFESDAVGCKKCHVFKGDERGAGPDLKAVGDKYGREQLIRSVLEPNAWIHPDYGTIVATTTDGKVHTGVLHKRTDDELQLLDAEGKLLRLPRAEVEQEKRTGTSLMPAGLNKTMKAEQFADLIAYLETLKQPEGESRLAGMPSEIPAVEKPIRLAPLHKDEMRFDHPVWIVAIPGSKSAFLVVEQKARKIWRFEVDGGEHQKELFADFSDEASTGDFEGVVCVAFHPRFLENRKYYVNYHVRNQGSFFSPVIVERQATADLRRDAGVPSRRLLQIHQDTDLHWGGMLAFGPDGFLYIGAGDAGPQEDPEGHSQDLSRLTGAILRIDVDRQEGGEPYAIPESNPYRNAPPPVRPEIWASGFRMPWRFSFDPVAGDLWVGDVGQDLFEEVSIARAGENHGWNVYEGFMKFSDRYRREGEKYTPPVLAYKHKLGPSVTGGYVYRGKRNPSYYGAYIFGDFESKRVWALTQADRKLTKVRQIGESPQKIASFGVDSDGELLLVGYEGTIFRLVLDDSDFDSDPGAKAHVRMLRDNAPAAARVSIIGNDGKPYGPVGAAARKTNRDESYFYADDSFDVKLPPGRARLNFSGGVEFIPQTVTLDAETTTELTVRMQQWIDMASRGWYSGDSHVHLHTGGPIDVKVADALVAARAEGVNYVNLCVSNNVGDDIRDAELITGKPHAASTDRHLLVFGEEMRSTIYGHMQFFGIKKLVEPQYTGFDDTPNRNDFPANHVMAAEAVRQGGVVTYGHPLFANQPFPFEKDLAQPSGAARELPIDAVLGVVHAVDLMSYNSDESQSVELWYRLLNCGLKLSACVGTDALLDRSAEPLGGDRVYVKTAGPLTMQSWLDGLKGGRSFVTNGPIPTLEVNGKGPGETCELAAAGNVRASVTVESYAPFSTIEVIVNGKVSAHDETPAGDEAGLRVRRLDFELPIERSSWVALRVRGPNHHDVFDGAAWAHTSPVYVDVAGQRIVSRQDAEYFVDWTEKMLGVVAARNRFASVEDRRQVETLFRRARDEFRKRADAK
ncbi:MAG: CehA/McbA family metallohydrolase [Paludisphaera borealis]|uniref:CehA/McbA family metallohydrolase n=1 Tax=Paludisphaera borealis TaxID=1387353 RepID=UPI002848B432|nr:CehA/McbA family metallohydrolase [Paludisphaera borealis]MDR3623378.1 CehA/McbA family metallohydrolase [Paludisphaera borealis]